MTKHLKLVRCEYSADETFGVLLIEGHVLCLTLELPWLGNARNISCIPEGAYMCDRVISPRFGETFMVDDVPGRSEILFHAGNTAEDSRGCIILGSSYGKLGNKRAVLGSRAAIKQLMSLLEGQDGFTFKIVSA